MDILNLPLEELGKLFVSIIPIGFLVGCFPMIIGVAIDGIIRIFKKVTGVIGDILPIALPVVGAGIVIGVGIGIFKKVAKPTSN